MKKYIAISIIAVGLVLTYQNCETGYDTIENTNNSKIGTLGFGFDNEVQNVLTSSTSIIVEGNCNVVGYQDHRVDWEFNYNGLRYQGRTDRPCSTFSGRFSLVINVSSLSRQHDSELVFVGILTGLKNGIATRGQTAQIRVRFQSTTGGTTGTTTGSTSGTTGGQYGETCEDQIAQGLPEYCSGDVNYNSYCASITYPPDEREVVEQVASERPDLLSQCARNASENANWNAFTKEVVRRLRLKDERWGFNGVRGNINDINGDTIAWWGAPGGPQEGQTGNVVVDIVQSCGGTESPSWQVEEAYCGCCIKWGRWTLAPLN